MDRDDLELIADGLDRILADAPLETIDKAAGQGEEAEALWNTLAENGYPMLCVGEEQGGFGASLADACRIAIITGRHGAAVPLADTILAQAVLSLVGGTPTGEKIALRDPCDPAAPIPHAGQVHQLLMLEEGQLICAQLNSGEFEPVQRAEDGAAYFNPEPENTVQEYTPPDWLTPQAFRALAGLIRSASMAGAMEAVLDLTLSFTQEREQFGRPLAKFQAIQHHLSDIACETAASIAAVELASDALRAAPEVNAHVIEEIAIAKIRCGQAASRIAAAAHQAHGAIGFTREYILGRYTRRLWQWQDEFGSEAQWAIELGRSILSDAEPQLWPRISQPF